MTKYYINQAGNLCSTNNPPAGCHFERRRYSNFTSVLIVSDADGEVIDEYVLWDSIDSIWDETGIRGQYTVINRVKL